MAAVYPHTTYRPVSGERNDPPIIPVGCILHVAVSEARSLYDYFDGPSGGIESHLYIRRDGSGEQYRDLDREADANLQANSWIGSDGRRYGFHSIETQGMEHGEWTAAQIRAIKQFLAWDAERYGWPLRVVPSNNWRSGGVGYHVMLGAPGPWTPVAKTCPGPDRVRQFKQIIVPWLQGDHQEDDMPLNNDDKNWLKYTLPEFVAGEVRKEVAKITDIRWGKILAERNSDALAKMGPRLSEIRAAVNGEQVDVTQLAAELAPLLVAPIVADIPETTEEQVEDAIRNVLGSLNDE